MKKFISSWARVELIIVACWLEAATLVQQAKTKGLRWALDQAGGIQPSKTIILLIMGFVVIMFLLAFVPQLEDAITFMDIDDPFVSAILPMMVWILPIGALIAIIVAIFKHAGGSK